MAPVPPTSGGGGRRLNRTLGVDWEEPPSSLLDVEVFIVYRDGSRELIEDEYLTLLPEGVRVEDYRPDAHKNVRQFHVDWNENFGPIERLVDFLRNLDEEYEKTRAEYRDWREERRERKRD